MRRSLAWFFGGVLVLAAGAAGQAGSSVLFEDGRTLLVESIELADATVFLTLEGDGRISVPAERIVNLSDLAPELKSDSPESDREELKTQRPLPASYADLIEEAARRHELDPALLMAVAQVEFGSARADAHCGVLSLAAETAERFGIADPCDPQQSVEGGALYLTSLIDRYNGRTDLALAAYEAGENAVNHHRGIPPYRGTRRFVDRVLERVGTKPNLGQ